MHHEFLCALPLYLPTRHRLSVMGLHVCSGGSSVVQKKVTALTHSSLCTLHRALHSELGGRARGRAHTEEHDTEVISRAPLGLSGTASDGTAARSPRCAPWASDGRTRTDPLPASRGAPRPTRRLDPGPAARPALSAIARLSLRTNKDGKFVNNVKSFPCAPASSASEKFKHLVVAAGSG